MLVNEAGERFVLDEPAGDFALTVVVARAIVGEMTRTGSAVYLKYGPPGITPMRRGDFQVA